MNTEDNNKQNQADQESDNSGATNAYTKSGFKKEDMLDMQKGAAAMDHLKKPEMGIEGNTISGTGSGPGTGEVSADFDRPTTEGTPPVNDYVDPEGINDSDIGRLTESQIAKETEDLPKGYHAEGEEASGFPGGGAVRTAEDRIPPARSEEDSPRFSTKELKGKPKP